MGVLNFKKGHVTQTTLLSGEIFHLWGGDCHYWSICQIRRA